MLVCKGLIQQVTEGWVSSIAVATCEKAVKASFPGCRLRKIFTTAMYTSIEPCRCSKTLPFSFGGFVLARLCSPNLICVNSEHVYGTGTLQWMKLLHYLVCTCRVSFCFVGGQRNTCLCAFVLALHEEYSGWAISTIFKLGNLSSISIPLFLSLQLYGQQPPHSQLRQSRPPPATLALVPAGD